MHAALKLSCGRVTGKKESTIGGLKDVFVKIGSNADFKQFLGEHVLHLAILQAAGNLESVTKGLEEPHDVYGTILM